MSARPIDCRRAAEVTLARRRCGPSGSSGSSASSRRAPTSGFHRGGPGPRRSARSRAVRRSRPGSARRRSRRSWRASSASISARPRARSSPRPAISRRILTNLEDARRPVHRRDPSPQSGGGGDPLSGDGGLPARSDHRRGPGGALGQDRPRALHPDRRDHPRRAPDHSAARPLRHPDPAQFLYDRGARADRRARRAGARHRHAADGANEIARRSRGTPRIAGRLLRRVRDFAVVDRRRRASTGRSPTARSGCSRSTDRPRRDGPPLPHDDRRSTMAAARSGSRPSPRRSRSRATPSRTSSSRF